MELLDQARSFVDPTTNEIVIKDFDPAKYMGWLKGRHVSGSELLANFLHEYTHHWCFDSRVGSTLALLRMRAACRVFRGRPSYDDYVRCMTASAILEPIAEGLALFAEFDTYPGPSRWSSQTLVASLVLFAPAVDTKDPDLVIQALLQKLRRDPLLLERKAGIYSLPASINVPYLVGYLAVHSVWCCIAAACDNDRDLFLSYLRSYIYDDPGMVIRMLDSYASEVRAAEAIVNHLSARMRELICLGGISQRVERWILSAEAGSVDVESISAKSSDEQRARRLFDEALVADVTGDDEDLTLGAWTKMTLEERPICLIASTPAAVKSNPAMRRLDVAVRGIQEPVFGIASDSLSATGDGELVFVSSSDGCGFAILLRVDSCVTVLSTLGEFPEADLATAIRKVTNRPVAWPLYEKFRADLERSSLVKLVWDIVAKQVRPAIAEIYGPIMTLNASEVDWPKAYKALEQHGLFGLLGKNGELTRALAAIGLVNTFSTNVNVIKMVAQVLKVDEAAMEEAMNLLPRNGLPLVAREGVEVIALV
jgi:hypothetical protein